MEKYLSEFSNYKIKIAYYFKTSNDHCGGIGDYIKYLSFLIKIGIKYNIAIYVIHFSNIHDEFLKLIHDKMYIKFEEISSNVVHLSGRLKEEDFTQLQSDVFNVINPASLFNFDATGWDQIINIDWFLPNNMNLYDIFYFNDSIIKNIPDNLKNIKYISIHIRTYTDRKSSGSGLFSFNEDNLDRFISEKKDSTPIFLCTDSIILKKRLQDKYKNVLTTDFGEIGHTGDLDTTKKSILNTITELFILANSEAIFTADTNRVSGFSLVASRFKNINFKKISSLYLDS